MFGSSPERAAYGIWRTLEFVTPFQGLGLSGYALPGRCPGLDYLRLSGGLSWGWILVGSRLSLGRIYFACGENASDYFAAHAKYFVSPLGLGHRDHRSHVGGG
jgi:hypothetical protein